MKKLIPAAAGLAALAAICAPFADAHATVNLLLGKSVTASTATWFLRVPNEKPKQSTYRVTMLVPAAIQQSVSVRQTPGWKVTLVRKDTGQKDGEGNPVYATTKIVWRAEKGHLIRPGMYGSFEFRFRAPTAAGSLCFSIYQLYTPPGKGMPTETVAWTGPAGSDKPASCVAITDS